MPGSSTFFRRMMTADGAAMQMSLAMTGQRRARGRRGRAGPSSTDLIRTGDEMRIEPAAAPSEILNR
jgi:hypothetical protein